MGALNDLRLNQEQVRTMNETDLMAHLSKLDIEFAILTASPIYDTYMGNVKTHSSPENKEFAAANSTRNRIINRLVFWYGHSPAELYPSMLTLKELNNVINEYNFPSLIECVGKWSFERNKSKLDIQLNGKIVVLTIEHRRNKIISVSCLDQAQNKIGYFTGKLIKQHVADVIRG